MRTRRPEKGSIIVLTLLTLVVLFLYACALVSLNMGNLNYTQINRNSLNAQQLAQAGLNHALNTLMYRSSFGEVTSDKLEYPPASVPNRDSYYYITFNPAEENYSVNNLKGVADHPTLSSLGESVKPHTIDLIIMGKSGLQGRSPITRRIHVILYRNIDFDLSIGADGIVGFEAYGAIGGDDRVAGIKSMLDLENESGGGIHSNSEGDNDDEPAVWMPKPDDVLLGPKVSLSAVGEFCTCWDNKNPRNYDAFKPLPEFSVQEIVGRKKWKPSPAGSPLEPGWEHDSITNTYKYTNPPPPDPPTYLSVDKEEYVNGNLIVNGDLNLSGSSLFVDGNLTINGGLTGYGGIYVTGDVTVQGGNVTLETNKTLASTIYADGSIDIKGLGADDYLADLVSDYPTIAPKYDEFTQAMNAVKTFFERKETTGQWDYQVIKNEFGEPPNWVRKTLYDGVEGPLPDPPPAGQEDRIAVLMMYWVDFKMTINRDDTRRNWTQPIANPDGSYSTGDTDGIVPGLIEQIKTSMGANAEVDPNAKKVLQGLKELAYFYRNSWDGTSFHDENLPPVSQSLEHQTWYTANGEGTPLGTSPANSYALDPDKTNEEVILEILKNFVAKNDPLDSKWSKSNYIQGVLYANGDIILTEMLIYGSVIGHQRVTSRDSSFIYVEEFRNLYGETAPLGVILYQDL